MKDDSPAEAARRAVAWRDANMSEWDRYYSPLENVISPDEVIDICRAYLRAVEARDEVIEECAKVADRMRDDVEKDSDWNYDDQCEAKTLDLVASAIRSLKSPPTGEPSGDDPKPLLAEQWNRRASDDPIRAEMIEMCAKIADAYGGQSPCPNIAEAIRNLKSPEGVKK